MEDFGSVLWILFIVGAMIFNVVSQSRKAREKGSHAPHHEEAWPPQAGSGAPDTQETPARPVFQPVTPAFPDECQSLEEIPEQEYVPEFTVQKAADSSHFNHQTTNRLKGGTETEEIAAHELADAFGATAATAPDIAEEFDLRRAVIYSEILKPKFEEPL